MDTDIMVKEYLFGTIGTIWNYWKRNRGTLARKLTRTNEWTLI